MPKMIFDILLLWKPGAFKTNLLNIYGNCIKYNHIGGSIITTSDYTETDDGVVMYEWTITDTGIGMSKEYKEHIFEPFSQERQYIGSTHHGIGLGMSIVKGLIEKMGGSIEVESEEGVGSTFIIKIPFKNCFYTI